MQFLMKVSSWIEKLGRKLHMPLFSVDCFTIPFYPKKKHLEEEIFA